MAKTIKERVVAIITEQLAIEPERVTDMSTMEDLGADSLDAVEVVMAIEEEFSLQMPDQDVDALKTIGDIVDYVATKRPSEDVGD